MAKQAPQMNVLAVDVNGRPLCQDCLCSEWSAGPICECGNCQDCCTCADDECDCEACQYRRENYDASAEDQALYEAEND